jgi:hypothetical protein
VADDYRQRCADAALRYALAGQELTSTSQSVWVSALVDAVLAVRDQDAETLRSENKDLRKAADHAEAGIARVRALHTPDQPPEGHQWVSGGRQPKCEGCDHEGNPFTAPDWPCDTIRALDGEDPGRG